MYRCFSAALVFVLVACAQPSGTIPSGERGGRAQVTADFAYTVGESVIRGSYNPQIFRKDGVLGHVRNSCRQGEITNYNERRTARRVTFTVNCRQRVIAASIGRWVVERAVGGAEQARKI